MVANHKSLLSVKALAWLLLACAVVLAVAGAARFAVESWPRGEAFETAMQPVVDGKDAERAQVAMAIRDNYREARQNASRWSGVYWGCTFFAAIFSALAALVLKLESHLFKAEATKKDVAALLSVAAALLVTLSSSGDFQRKWQANRIAAAELERIGYAFLENDGANARSYFAQVGQILERRHLSIVGSTDKPKAGAEQNAVKAPQ